VERLPNPSPGGCAAWNRGADYVSTAIMWREQIADVVGEKNVSDILIIVYFRNQMAGDTDHTGR